MYTISFNEFKKRKTCATYVFWKAQRDISGSFVKIEAESICTNSAAIYYGKKDHIIFLVLRGLMVYSFVILIFCRIRIMKRNAGYLKVVF